MTSFTRLHWTLNSAGDLVVRFVSTYGEIPQAVDLGALCRTLLEREGTLPCVRVRWLHFTERHAALACGAVAYRVTLPHVTATSDQPPVTKEIPCDGRS